MKIIILFITLFLSQLTLCQTIVKSSIDNGGASISITNIALVYTIGEVNVQEVTAGKISMSEGFIGSDLLAYIIVPDIEILPDIMVECEASPTAPTAANGYGDVFTGTPDVTFPITTQGTLQITWTYDDGNGNTATQTQQVIIEDVTPPEAYSVATYTHYINEDNDNEQDYEYCDSKKKKVYVCHNGNTICVSINAVNTHLNHGDQLGQCGNNTPILTVMPSDIDEGSYDNCGDVTLSLSQTEFSNPGTYIVSLFVEDSSGNVSTSETTVEIIDFNEISKNLRFGQLKLTVYPVPFSNEINISFSEPTNLSNVDVKLFDFYGRNTGIHFYPNNQNLISDDTSCLADGVYVIRVRIRNKVRRAIIMKD